MLEVQSYKIHFVIINALHNPIIRTYLLPELRVSLAKMLPHL